MDYRRYHDMDWLRVLAFMLLMFYHVGMIFVGWEFHLRNPQEIEELQPVMIFMNQWRLPLLFAISGAGTWFALRRRSLPQFAGERTRRLLLPLAFGMFLIVPPQVYVEYVVQGRIEPGYLAFQGSVFEMVPYPDGSFSWHHLWFVAYLFVFSILALPIFKFLRGRSGAALLEGFRNRLAASPALLLSLALPLALVSVSMTWRWPETHALTDDFAALARYFLLFWLGFIVMGYVPIRERAVKSRKLFLICTALVFVPQRILVYNFSHEGIPIYVIYQTLRSFYCWFAILTMIGYAAKYLDFSNRFLRYANQAVYPYYILHQTVMMILAYWILPMRLSAVTKFLAILLGMFLISGLIYEFLIRRFSLIRPLFGLKMRGESKSPIENEQHYGSQTYLPSS